MIVLGIDKNTPVATLVELARTVVDKMALNKATFVSPDPPLAMVTAAADKLQSIQATFKGGQGSRLERDEAFTELFLFLTRLRLYVHAIGVGNPAEEARIAEEAGMKVRRQGVYKKSELVATSLGGGRLKVVTRGVKGAQAYEFQHSIDGGKRWISTMWPRVSLTLDGFEQATRVMFRVRAITPKGAGPWSSPVSVIVT